MNDMLFRTLLKRYEANIEDALYKIQSFNENNIIIPEHIDITGEVDKLLLIIAEALPVSEPVPAVVGTAIIGAILSLFALFQKSPISSKSQIDLV